MYINQIILQGKIAKEIKLIEGKDSLKFCYISIITEETFFNKKTSETSKNSTLHLVKCFGLTSMNVSEFYKKGDLICIKGSQHRDSWEDRDGKQQSITYVKPFNNSLENISLITSCPDHESTKSYTSTDIPF